MWLTKKLISRIDSKTLVIEPEGEVPAALISFNIGVEAGQLLVVTAVLAALALLRRIRPADEPLVLRAAAYPVGIVGAYWLIERIAA